MEFGDLLKVIGEFGRFQKRLIFLLCVLYFFTSFHLFSQVFIAMEVPHYCNTSWIHRLGLNLTRDQELNLTIPRKPDGSFEKCRMVTPVQGNLQSLQLNSTEQCRDGWVYPEKLQPTLLTEFDLVCERKNLKEISQSLFMVGVLIGALVFGPLSDRIGSRDMILLTVLLMGSFGVGAGLAPTLHIYIAMRFLVGSAFAGISISMAALTSEWVGASHRPFAMIITHCFYAVGQIGLVGLAYRIREWRLYQIVGSIPTLCLFFYAWFVDSLVYYGMSHQIGDFGLDIYMTQLVFGAVEIPARVSCIFLLHWLGRRKCQAGWLLLGGVVCMIIPAVPQTSPVTVTVLAVINKAALGASFSTTYLWSVEVFPTVVRQTCLGLCSMSARIGGIIAPLANLLDDIHPAISMVLFGVTALVGGILCFFLRETQNRDLQDDTTVSLSSQPSVTENY
ncbi:UNVERIFIED_CONTAM: hypothetical protein K2H54_011132 [Gekko kuhli]